MAWRCTQCGQLHTRNAKSCRGCGHQIFRPVSDAELEQLSTEGDGVEPMELDRTNTVGSAPEEQLASSPDVNPDGSIAGETRADPEPGVSLTRRARRWLSALFQ